MEKISDKLLNWASIIDDVTREQAIMSSEMPFIAPYMALMPDAHLGRGATVGSVIPTQGAIMSAAVGVDIGCVDEETEYLSPMGWEKISEYKNGLVGQYNPDTHKINFVKPKKYIKRKTKGFYHIKTKYGLDQMVSPDHRVLLWKVFGRNEKQVQEVLSAKELAEKHNKLKLGAKVLFETSGFVNKNSKINLTDEQLRIMVMVIADGNFPRNTKNVVLHLKKERKIKRCKKLLQQANLKFTESKNNNNTTNIRFQSPLILKTYKPFWKASNEQLKIIGKEILLWDGSKKDNVFFTRDKDSADFINYVFMALGYRSVLRKDIHYRDRKVDYRVFKYNNNKVGLRGSPKSSIKFKQNGEYEYCFIVPSSFFVIRRNGNIVMTGNCGMIAVKTQFNKVDLEGMDLSKLRHSIERSIPLSAGRYNNKLTRTAEKRLDDLKFLANKDYSKFVKNWEMQLGSLGSGNHFIEISLDEEDNVWLFLHSGSRGVGNKIAMYHIGVAKELMEKYFIKLPDPDLAYFAEDTREFDDYIDDLNWAQKFALLNREEMMDRVIKDFQYWIGGNIEELERINCHHNFTQKENHFGKNIWLTRKGAIEASEGKLGLIPGSMGTASYVVVGKGHAPSFNSAPHGAGRNFSRSHARKTFTFEQLEEAMEGKEWSHSKAFLDEIPGAYKDIDVIMKDAEDLVMVVHTLSQIVNIKGD